MDSKIDPLQKVYACIKKKENFVLQGGAGSGKTESLKRVLEHISKVYPESKIACITHTNLAVNEIKSRVNSDNYTICTIHSFINNLIKDYKRNLHEVISDIFKLDPVKNSEHAEYKKIYEKYASLLYTVKKETISKVVGKREYDKNSDTFNSSLNKLIDELNTEIENIIKEKDFHNIRYNETRFDNFNDLSFGHNSLLTMASLLFNNYSLLSKILQDKYDFIFVDEYQDTKKEIIEIFLNKIPYNTKPVVGLFGDSMQGIYDDGIGDIKDYLSKGLVYKIEKEDNFRCSEQVVTFINQLRDDDLTQEVAFKIINGSTESIEDRQGEVKLYYSVYDGERTSSGNPRDRVKYIEHVNSVVEIINKKHKKFRKLMLTNKSIAKEVGFENLYNVFDARYTDVKEEIEKDLERLQLLDLAELIRAYLDSNFNYVISELKKSGYNIKTVEDKLQIISIFNDLSNSEYSAMEILEIAFENKLINKSNSYLAYIDRKNNFLQEIKDDNFYVTFRDNYTDGKNTFTRMSKEIEDLNEAIFKENERLYKKERFYKDLFSNKVKFKEILNYLSYLNEETSYITMHKTKGSGIDNVMVILEEFFWNKYKFKTIYDSNETNHELRLYNLKLIYVACSRAIKNLICIKIISSEEKDDLLRLFENHEEIKI